MQKISSADGLFHNGDKSQGIIGTPLTADWHNAVQAEIIATILAAGLTLDPNNNGQLLAAIQALIEAKAGNYALDTGSVNAYVVALNPAVSAYVNGLQIKFRATTTNTGAAVVNAGAGNVPLLRDDGQAVQSGDVPAQAIVTASYDQTLNAFLINSIVNSQIVSLVAALLLSSPSLGGSPSAPTPPQFDSSTRLATMAAVQRALGNLQGFVGVTASATLTAAQAGSAVQFAGATASTITLPIGSQVPLGNCFWFFNQGSVNLTVAVQTGNFLYAAPLLGSSNTTLILPPGDSLQVLSRGTGEWDVIGGSAALPYSFGFRMNQMGACNVSYVSANTTLLSTDVGRAFNFASAATVTLPPATNVASGKVFKFRSSVAGAIVTVNGGSAGSDSIYIGASGLKTLGFVTGDTVTLMSDGGGAWIAVDGSLIVQNLATLALSGTPTAPSPSMWDNTTRIATTWYVEKMLGNLPYFVAINASTTLTNNQAGLIINFFGTDSTNSTVTLPPSGAVNAGGCFRLYNRGSVPVTLAVQGTDYMTHYPLLGSSTTYTVMPGDDICIMSRGTGEWNPVEGSALLPLAYGFRMNQMGACNLSNVSAASTLLYTDVGRAFNLTSAVALTLPLANSVSAGKVFKFRAAVAGASVVAGSNNAILLGSTTLSSVSFSIGDTLTLMSDGASNWLAVDGTAMMGFSGRFANSKNTSAAYSYLPNGWLIQCGQLPSIAAASSAAITFATAFPNAVVHISTQLTLTTSDFGGHNYPFHVVAATQGGFTCDNRDTSANTGTYIAIGY